MMERLHVHAHVYLCACSMLYLPRGLIIVTYAVQLSRSPFQLDIHQRSMLIEKVKKESLPKMPLVIHIVIHVKHMPGGCPQIRHKCINIVSLSAGSEETAAPSRTFPATYHVLWYFHGDLWKRRYVILGLQPWKESFQIGGVFADQSDTWDGLAARPLSPGGCTSWWKWSDYIPMGAPSLTKASPIVLRKPA